MWKRRRRIEKEGEGGDVIAVHREFALAGSGKFSAFATPSLYKCRTQ